MGHLLLEFQRSRDHLICSAYHTVLMPFIPGETCSEFNAYHLATNIDIFLPLYPLVNIILKNNWMVHHVEIF